ncbi:MAG: dUTP diphosphatase [Clostridia bacterium]|nr:dUTP diphosphatase [Clostridia bacterium]
MKVKLKKLNERAVIPAYGSPYSAGADLYNSQEEPVTLKSGESFLFHTGIAMEIPQGYVGLVYARSGLASKKGLAPANKVGVIDADYRGEIMVCLHNHSKSDQTVEPGERIAQIVIAPFLTADYEEVNELSDTLRGEGGFGSTGAK